MKTSKNPALPPNASVPTALLANTIRAALDVAHDFDGRLNDPEMTMVVVRLRQALGQLEIVQERLK